VADFLAGQVPTAAELILASRAGECLDRAQRITDSTGSATTTLVPVLRLDDVPITAGRAVIVESSGILLDSSVADDVGLLTVTYTTDGSTPTIASAVLPGAVAERLVRNISFPETCNIRTRYTPAGNETLSLLLCVSRAAGTGTIVAKANGTSSVMELTVIDAGVDGGDHGTDL
jgi:hypothetical protein